MVKKKVFFFQLHGNFRVVASFRLIGFVNVLPFLDNSCFLGNYECFICHIVLSSLEYFLVWAVY
jgi:hypothetical protein